jgi:hypothetical protein
MRNNPGERDRSIEALLRRQREDAAPSPATELCVDAETLAAWIDGSLVGEDLAAAERHSAGCARCQAMLASMAHIAPPVASRPWWRSVTIRWVAPVAATATALALWVSVDRQRNTAVAPAAQTATSRAAEPVAPSAPSPDERSRFNALQTPGAPAASAKAAAPSDTVARRESSSGFAARRGAGVAQTGSETRQALQARSDKATSVATPAAATPAPTAPPLPAAPPPPAPVARSTIPPVQPVAVDALKPPALAETVNVTAESPSLEKRAAGQASGGVALRTTDILSDIQSPEPAFRWRIGAPGTMLRSTDSGATWTSQRTAIPVVFAAGAAPARDVCWIVGRSGAVMLSTDGTTWQLRPFPEPVNLTAVRAVDSKTAVVTTADGRQFSTTDGGASWSKLPLQEK